MTLLTPQPQARRPQTRRPKTRRRWPKLAQPLTLFSLVIAIAMMAQLSETAGAQPARRIEFSGGPAQVQGSMAGRFNLTQLAARDRNRRLCLGYGTQQPNHTFVLNQPQSRLRVAVDSSGQDTTLLIQGPEEGSEGIRCNDNHRRDSRDAAIGGNDWPEGTYNVWVGTYEEGDQVDYELRIFEPAAGDNRR